MNYKEASSEDEEELDFNSVESSFNDSEDLTVEGEKTKYRTRSLVAEVTNRLHKLSTAANEVVGEEIVEEGFVAETEDIAENQNINDHQIARMPNYDALNGVDEDKAMQNATAALRNFKFMEDDLTFFFQQLEIKMKSNGVKKNFTKLEVLTTVLPIHVINGIKPLLRKQEDEFPANDAYLQAKREIMRLFGPTEESHFQKAMSRVLSGKPSQLANDLINDMCEHDLEGCCCRRWIFGLWHRQLPSAVKQAVAHKKFSKETLKEVLELADKVYESTRPPPSIAAVQQQAHDEAFHQDWQSYAQGEAETPEVAALGRGRGRGRGRGGGGRGAQQGRGAAQATTTTRVFYTKDNPRWTTPRHADLPPFHACKPHWTWGKSCFKCAEPSKCPWKKFVTPRASNTN